MFLIGNSFWSLVGYEKQGCEWVEICEVDVLCILASGGEA